MKPAALEPGLNSISGQLAAKRGSLPTPEKNIETMPCWGKNSPDNFLVDLVRDTRTSTQSRRLVRWKGASWSHNWPSGANSLAHVQLGCILYAPLSVAFDGRYMGLAL